MEQVHPQSTWRAATSAARYRRFFLALASAAVWLLLFFQMRRAEFWEFQIRAFEKADPLRPPEPWAVLFTGSSSIRLWRMLERDMALLRVLNRSRPTSLTSA